MEKNQVQAIVDAIWATSEFIEEDPKALKTLQIIDKLLSDDWPEADIGSIKRLVDSSLLVA